MRWVWPIVVAVLLLVAPSARADSANLPSQLYLPAQHFWQSRNNCGPTSIAMAASVFGVAVNPEAARWTLRPEPESIGMDPSRVPGYVASLGLQARPRVNGSADLVRRLLASDVPVVVNQWLSLSQHIEHYRLVIGYDLASRSFLVHDSTRGPNLWLSESEFMTLWTPTGRAYIPVYRPNQADAVAALIGVDWDDTTMYARALDRAVKDVWGAPSDPWVWARLGSYAYAVGDAATALKAWQAALLLGLPQGDIWLPGWLAAAALDAADFDMALRYVDVGLQHNPSSAGLYYVRGQALKGLGRRAEAAAAFRRALDLEPTFVAAKTALEDARR